MPRRPRSERLRRTWPQRLLITFNVVCILGALVGAASLAYAKREVGQIDRVLLSQSDGFEGSRGLANDDPRNFLIVGADSDDGLDANDPARAGRDGGLVGGIRSDTIMVVRLDPATEQAQVLSFPRDLWVDIPGNSPGRINSALQFGGEQLLIDTIKSNFDIDINHYVQVDFAGFKDLVSILGGVPVWFDTAVRDKQSGLNATGPGCANLDENGALAYVRARHFQYYDEEAGIWRSDPTSDYGRVSRQQDFIKRVIRRAVAKGARNPVTLTNLVEVGIDNIRLDDETTPGDLIDLGLAFRNFDPETLQTFTLPVDETYRGGAAVLDLRTGEAEPILAMFRGTGDVGAGGTVSPAAVSVKVLNGTGVQDQASAASDVLATAGFSVEPPNSAVAVDRTEVHYAPGHEADAALVARYLYADPVLVLDLDATQITVITGPDFGSVILEPRPAGDVPIPTTTTTTAVPADGGETSAPGTVASTTTTTEPKGFVPEAAPIGEDCG